MTETKTDDERCDRCNGPTTEREDDAGPYRVCTRCGRRQGGLGRLQDRFGGIF